MKIKKKISMVLATAICLVQTNVVANPQKPLPSDGIYPVIVSHGQDTTSSNGDIKPEVKFTFKEAMKNDLPLGSDSDDDSENAHGYYLRLINSSGKAIVSRNIDPKEFKDGTWSGDIQTLEFYEEDNRGTTAKIENGQLYKIEVIPFHKHYRADGTWYYSPLDTLYSNPYKVFLTDFNTQIHQVAGKQELEIRWEYIPGASYEVRYTTDKVDGNTDFEDIIKVEKINAKDVDTFIDPETKIKYARFIITKPTAGAEYSAAVKATGFNYEYLPEEFRGKLANIDRNNGFKVAKVLCRAWLEVRDIGRDKIELVWDIGENPTPTKITIYSSENEDFKSQETIGTIYNNNPGRFEYKKPNKGMYYRVEFEIPQKGTLHTNIAYYIPDELREKPVKPLVPRPYSKTFGIEDGFTAKDYLVKNIFGTTNNQILEEENTFHTVSKNPIRVQLVWDAPEVYRNDDEEINLYYDVWVVKDKELLENEKLEPIVKDLYIDRNDNNQHIYADNGETIIGLKTVFDKYSDELGEEQLLTSNHTYYVKIMAKSQYGYEYEYSEPTVVAITVAKNGDIFAPPVIPKPPLKIRQEETTKTSITIEWLEKWLEDNNEITLGENIEYELKTVEYKDIIKQLDEENSAYGDNMTLEEFLTKAKYYGDEDWKTITPVDDNKDNLEYKTHKILQSLSQEKGPGYHDMEPNTRYVILLRAYRTLEDGTVLKQEFPSYVIGSTSPEDAPEPDPTVPNLNPNGTTDESVSVWWTYDEDFNYEIVYSRKDNPDEAKVWDFKISNVPGENTYVSNGSRAVVTITGLVPDTQYNVWIRAKQKIGDKVSKWSNPVTQKTKSIEDPDVPKGLGPAAYQTIVDLNLDFQPIGKDYITVEWLRDVEDLVDGEMGNKSYSYMLEFADNPEFLDSIEILSGDGEGSSSSEDSEYGYEILDKTVVKFTGLESNRPYYVKVKTILTYKDPESDRVIIKESAFSARVRIITKTSDDEYDGGENDNIIIYPDAVVDKYEGDVWTKEVVDTATIISQIQRSDKYFFTVEMKNYKGIHDASVRSLVMPKNIIDTLDNKGMALQIVTNVAIYEIPGKALRYYGNGYDARDKVTFDITKMTNANTYMIARPYPEQLVQGENFEVKITGSNRSVQVKRFDEYMKIKQKLDLLGQYQFENLNTYMYSNDTGGWTKFTPQQVTNKDSYLVYTTPYAGMHMVYRTVSTTSTLPTGNSTYIMNELKSKYSINGLGDVYGRSAYVGANQYIKLMMGIAQKSTQIDLTAAPTSDLKAKARTSGIYISYNTGLITAEQAISGVVKLYELSSGYRVKPSKVSIPGTSGTYQEAVSKAYALGLIENDFQPLRNVTYSQLCDWIIQVVQ